MALDTIVGEAWNLAFMRKLTHLHCARTFISDPDLLLVFDEATSAPDSRHWRRRHIAEAIESPHRGGTLMVAGGRPSESSSGACDRLVFISENARGLRCSPHDDHSRDYPEASANDAHGRSHRSGLGLACRNSKNCLYDRGRMRKSIARITHAT